MGHRLSIVLDQAEYEELVRLSEIALRSLEDQAHYLLREALLRQVVSTPEWRLAGNER